MGPSAAPALNPSAPVAGPDVDAAEAARAASSRLGERAFQRRVPGGGERLARLTASSEYISAGGKAWGISN